MVASGPSSLRAVSTGGRRVDILHDVINQVWDRLRDWLLLPLWADSLYRRGFLTGVFTTIVVGGSGFWLYVRIQIARAKIAAFFQPSAMPASRPGPSGANRARGCGSGIIELIGIGVLILVLVALAVVLIL